MTDMKFGRAGVRISHGAGNALKAKMMRQARDEVLPGMAVGMSEGSVHLYHGFEEPCTIGVCQAPWHHGSRLERVYIMGTVTETVVQMDVPHPVTYKCCDPCITRHTLSVIAPDRYRKTS